MGCFSYICNKCGENIREGERCVLRHIRHGEILGETTGTYDSYGRVDEDKVFRSWEKDGLTEINNHREICASEFDFSDSVSKECYSSINYRVYEGQKIDLKQYFEIQGHDYDDIIDTLKGFSSESSGIIDIDIIACHIDNLSELTADFESLPIYKEPRDPNSIKSGVVAFHAKCYHSLKDTPEDEKLRRTPSKGDPDQGCGRPRKRFL